jgi:hypothetical protein
MKQTGIGRAMARLSVAVAVLAGSTHGVVHASNNTCWSYNPGHIYYVAYQSNPPGPEYIVDLGDRSVFLTATDTIQPITMNLSASDFASIFSNSAPFLRVGFFGVQNPPTRDALMSTNGPKDDSQLSGCSTIGADSQIDSWATGIQATSSQIGSPICSPNAAKYAGSVTGSYQFTLNSVAQGSLSGNVVWNVETRLSDSFGTRTQTPKIHFDAAQNNPGTGATSRGYVGYFIVNTDGTAQFWPDADGDFLPDVPVGSDPSADKCPGINSTDNTDADSDGHAAPCDCQDGNPAVWGALPTEVLSVKVAADKSTITWTAPTVFYGSTPGYDVFRGQQPSLGAVPVYSCFSPNQPGAVAIDASTPTPGSLPFLYLVRAQTGCGDGPLGQGKNGPVRTVPSCP